MLCFLQSEKNDIILKHHSTILGKTMRGKKTSEFRILKMIKLHAGLNAICNLAQSFLLLLLQNHSITFFSMYHHFQSGAYRLESSLGRFGWDSNYGMLDINTSLTEPKFIYPFIYLWSTPVLEEREKITKKSVIRVRDLRVISCDCSTGSIPPLSLLTWSILLYCLKAYC